MVNEYSGMAYQAQQNIEAKKKQIALFNKNIIPALRKNYESTLLAYEQNTEELLSYTIVGKRLTIHNLNTSTSCRTYWTCKLILKNY